MPLKLACLALVIAAFAAGGCGVPSSNRPTDAARLRTPVPDGVLARGKIDHVVVIVMENRSFDDIFGGDSIPGHPTPYPGADAAVDPTIAPLMKPNTSFTDDFVYALHDTVQCLVDGGWTAERWKQISMNPAIASPLPSTCPNTTTGFHPDTDPLTTPDIIPSNPFQYLKQSQRSVYAEIARTYELGDHFFALTSTDSYPAHQYIVAGQSIDRYHDVVGLTYYVATPVPAQVGSEPAGSGCYDRKPYPNVRINVPALVTPAAGTTPAPNAPGAGYLTIVQRGIDGECYDVSTFADRLDEAKVSWAHYATQNNSGGLFNGFDQIKRWWTRQWPLATTVIAAARAAPLPKFVWVKPPCIQASDHPGTGDGGPSWVQDVVNAIGTSENGQWYRTAIFVVWDDYGGFYDHAIPSTPRPDGLGPGVRTPFLVISPYVKHPAGGPNDRGYVASGVADYGSILRFTEDLYHVAPIGPRTLDTLSPDLQGFFDFNQSPRAFKILTARPTITWRRACGLNRRRPAKLD